MLSVENVRSCADDFDANDARGIRPASVAALCGLHGKCEAISACAPMRCIQCICLPSMYKDVDLLTCSLCSCSTVRLVGGLKVILCHVAANMHILEI